MKQGILKRKEKIIITAIDLLDEVGINGLTMKEIANRQDITEPAVYRQFNSKMEIILTVLDQFSTYDINIKNTIESNKIEGKDGIKYLARVYAEYYQSYPQITTIMFSFDAFRYNKEINDKMVNIMEDRYHMLLRLVGQAIEKGEFPKATDAAVLTDTLFGSIWSTTFLWKLGHEKFNLKDRMIKAVEAILALVNNS